MIKQMITFLKLGKYGRFANQMYQIAGVIGIATRNGHSFAFPKWINYDHQERFGSSEDIEIYKHLQHELPGVPELRFEEMFVQWGYHDVRLSPDRAISIEGHLQSPRYFTHCIDIVRHCLTFKNEYPDNDYCAVHFRAGDYIDDPNAYHPRMPVCYYEQAIKNVPANKFLIFSDDKERANEIFTYLGVDFEISTGDYIDDFKLMKSCKHFIISNSSYSAMAATLANQPGKIVISPSGHNWFGEVAGITGHDIIDESWKQIRFERRVAA